MYDLLQIIVKICELALSDCYEMLILRHDFKPQVSANVGNTCSLSLADQS